MENILNLKTYIKYKSLIDSGQIITPNKELRLFPKLGSFVGR